MKQWVAAALILGACVAQGQGDNGDRDTLYQVSTIGALLEGVYDGETTFSDLAERGDFGIGTVNGLDGEMIALGGRFCHVTSDGEVHAVGRAAKTPFAMVTWFEADIEQPLSDLGSFEALEPALDALLPSRNLVYAIRVDGTFRAVRTRSVPRQTPPYSRLPEVAKEQAVFEFADVEGTLVGFWCPGYIEGLNVPGYHLHFLTADRSGGGHVLELDLAEGTASIDLTSEIEVSLPGSDAFLSAPLEGDQRQDVEDVER